ncbi:MAG TPA: hypothetical protein VMW80_14255 [Candidatus Dormibacteraeota bacterium]|nr:hypothetical protein [Candidatus Dormibacteraeota bacterium]
MADKVARPTLFGRKAAPEREMLEAPEVLIPVEQLKEVEWLPTIGVLDQEDLLAQKILTSKFIPGCTTDADALGSCTGNATTAHLSERMATAGILSAVFTDGDDYFKLSAASTPAEAEMWAIGFYNLTTTKYGGPGGNWPPNDEGSSGIYCCEELEALGLTQSHRSATSVHGLLSLLQAGSAEVGGPWYNSMMTPDSQGFIDGDGSPEAIRAVLASGVAGGHERYTGKIVQLAIVKGAIDLRNTILMDRNSWDPNWGPIGGCYLYHASFLQATIDQTDWKQVVVAA